MKIKVENDSILKVNEESRQKVSDNFANALANSAGKLTNSIPQNFFCVSFVNAQVKASQICKAMYVLGTDCTGSLAILERPLQPRRRNGH